MWVASKRSCPRTTSVIALARVVDHDGEVIGDADVLARQHHVARWAGVDGDPPVFAGRPFAGFGEAQRSGRALGRGQVEAPGERLAGRQPRRLLAGGRAARRDSPPARRAGRSASRPGSALRVLNER